MFNKDDIIEFQPRPPNRYDAPRGALAKVLNVKSRYLNISWIQREQFPSRKIKREENREVPHTQVDGHYYSEHFILYTENEGIYR